MPVGTSCSSDRSACPNSSCSSKKWTSWTTRTGSTWSSPRPAACGPGTGATVRPCRPSRGGARMPLSSRSARRSIVSTSNGGAVVTSILTLLAALLGQPAPDPAIPNLTLPDVHRRPRALDGFKGAKAIVVVFVGAECPVANLYVPTLIDLHKEYAPRGV